MAKKTRQHRIGDAAKRILHDILDDTTWSVELSPDYGIDFRIQMLKGDDVSWEVFLVQIKGHERFVRTNKDSQTFVKHALRTDRLAEYFDTYREPVFLVLVETTTGTARYLFLQSYSKNPLLSPAWRSRKNVTVYVPDVQDFRDQRRFAEEVKTALRHMNDMYPGRIEAAIGHAETQYRKIDPRFDVKCDVRDGKPNFHFTAREDTAVGLKLNVASDFVKSRIDRLIDTGLPTEFERKEITFTGSPILDRVIPAGPLTIQYGKTCDIFFSLIRIDKKGHEAARLDGMRGTLTAGHKLYHFHAEMPSGPLVVDADNLPYSGASASLDMRFVLERWGKQPIRQLPGFDQLNQVLGMRGRHKFLFSIVLLDDGRFLKFALNDFFQEALNGFYTILDITSKQRDIARIADIEPRFRAKLTRDHIKEVQRVHTILTTGERSTPVHKARFTVKLHKSGVANILKKVNFEDVTLTSGEQLDFYAEPVPFGTSYRTFTRMSLANASAIRSQLRENCTNYVTVILEGQADSIMTERIEPKLPYVHGDATP